MSDRAELLLDLKKRVGCCIDEAEAKLHALSKDIWSCLELAYEETKAHDRLVAYFSQKEGWTVDSHFKLETAFRATWGATTGSDVVSVGFLCEYDALPGIGHACGHNLIAEVGAAAAVLENTQEFHAQCDRYHGMASHAAVYPWEVINALDAAVLCYNNLSVLQQMKPDRVHGDHLMNLL
ncbi:LOW QUALITY PROTEIN: peptidase M20 domain-containing protein 2-like [Acanthopagrus schlegelii]